jgi:hypothetical protein
VTLVLKANDSCTALICSERQRQSAQRTPSVCAAREWPQYGHFFVDSAIVQRT